MPAELRDGVERMERLLHGGKRQRAAADKRQQMHRGVADQHEGVRESSQRHPVVSCVNIYLNFILLFFSPYIIVL